MEVRLGYKQSEVGIIPEDWEVKPLPKVSWFQEGPGLRHWQFTSIGMKVINVTNLEDGVLNLERTDRHISISEFNRMYQHFAVGAADIVMASSGNSYSKTAVVRQHDLPLVMNTSVIRFKPLKACDYGYLWALLTSPLFKIQIDLMITGGAQPNFGPYHLKRVYVPVPPLPEQRAIAAILSDVDGLLHGLDKFIAKKRDLKKAAMQQLLTGQTRLPGFHGEWEVADLTDNTVKIGSGITPTGGQKVYIQSGRPFLRSQNIGWGSLLLDDVVFIGDDLHSKFQGTEVEIGDVFLNITGASIGRSAVADSRVAGGNVNQHVCIVRLNKNRLHSGYLNHMLLSDNGQRQIDSFQTGGNRQGLNFKQVGSLKIRFPALTEQTAIAEVLSDMDAELAALEQRRAKTQALKQGLMQELLTGRTRLI